MLRWGWVDSKLIRYPSRKQWARFWEESDRGLLLMPSHLGKTLRILEVMVDKTNGPDLDYSLESLRKLGQWYVELAEADLNGEQWLDFVEWPPDPPPAGVLISRKYPERKTSKTIDAIHLSLTAYCDEVEKRLVPEARDVCWRAGHADDHLNGRPLLDVGDPTSPHVPSISVLYVVRDAYRYYFTPGHPYYRPPNPDAMADIMLRRLEERRQWIQTNGSPVWQVAPTGPRAFEGRTPMKRASYKWVLAYKRGEVGIPTIYRGPEPPPDPDPQIGMR
jgi:hypothetical protein